MTAPQSPRSIRWWPGIAVAVLALGALMALWSGETDDSQIRVFKTMAVLFVSGLGLFLWLMFFARLSGRARLRWLGGLALAAALGAALFRIEGVTGNFVPILAFRFGGGESFEEGSGGGGVATSPYDYPQFLGPNRNAVISTVTLAEDWDASPPEEVWRRKVGDGWSAFAVVGDAAVTQEQRQDGEVVVRYALKTGDVVWTSDVVPDRFDSTIGGHGPRATPTIADGRVFVFGATGKLRAYGLADGNLLWSRDVVQETGAKVPEWGLAGSPLWIPGDPENGDGEALVVVSSGGAAGKSMSAYRAADGEPVWTGGSDRAGYSSPSLVTLAGVPQIVVLNGASVAGHDPDDGSVLWTREWSGQQPNVAQPLPFDGERLLVSSGYGIGASMFRFGLDDGGKLTVDELWHSPRLKAKFTNVVRHGDHIYGLDDGVLVCLDPETGERCWKRGRYGHGQLILVGNLLVVQTEDGEIVLLEANPEEHRELGRFRALEGKSWNNPALSGPYLLVRNAGEAACYRLPLAS